MSALLADWREPLQSYTAENTSRIDTVVLPLDSSALSKAALPVAQTLARLENATLHVVYVGEQLLDSRETLLQLGISHDELGRAVLDQLTGDPAEAICSFAERQPSPLIVMCTHTGSTRIRASLGSVAEGVLRAAPARIVLVAPSFAPKVWQIQRVVLAHDGTPSSDLATGPAADIAARADGEVIALHVAASRVDKMVEPGSLPAPRYIDQPQHEWPAWAGAFVERMMALGAPATAVNFKLLVTGGQAGSEIAQFARDHKADLVVMAWHGNWKPHRAGPLKVVVRRSGCPVLLISAPRSK